MTSWQPIETAPKDGSRILVAPGFEEPVSIGYFSKHDGWMCIEGKAWGGCDCCGSGCGHAEIKPTLWHPIPEPPND